MQLLSSGYSSRRNDFRSVRFLEKADLLRQLGYTPHDAIKQTEWFPICRSEYQPRSVHS